MNPSGARRLGTPRPVSIRADDRGVPTAVGEMGVESVREEWVVEDRWWTSRPLRRRYFELVLADGRNTVVYPRPGERRLALPAGLSQPRPDLRTTSGEQTAATSRTASGAPVEGRYTRDMTRSSSRHSLHRSRTHGRAGRRMPAGVTSRRGEHPIPHRHRAARRDVRAHGIRARRRGPPARPLAGGPHDRRGARLPRGGGEHLPPRLRRHVHRGRGGQRRLDPGPARTDLPARDLDAALSPRFERRGCYFVPAEDFDWDQIPGRTYIPDIEPSSDPDAWRADDALFVPLRGAAGKLLGVVSVDEPETGRRPTDEEIDALVASSRHAALAIRIAQDVAAASQHQRMLEHVLEVSARLAEAGDVDALLQAVCDGIRDALAFDKVVIELANEPRRPAGARGRQRLDGGRPRGEPRPQPGVLRAAVHARVRGGRLLPRAARRGRGAPRAPARGLRVRVERPRAARLAPSLAARAAVRARRAPDRPDLGRRPARPPAPLAGAHAGPAPVRQPGHVRAPLGRPGGPAALRRDARPAHRAAEPARAPGPPAPGAGGGRRAPRARSR